MNNVSLDTTGFSEQLGIYDFFNVLVYGAIFVCGICVINTDINNYLWCDLTFPKGLGIALMIYIVGMILQEFGSFYDRKRTKIYKNMSRSILKGDLDDKYKLETTNIIIKNPIVLKQYRELSKNILKDYVDTSDEKYVENDYANGFMFSICQYYVSVHGKDKKIERIRALFSMSKTLSVCFFVLALLTAISLLFNTVSSINITNIIGFSMFGCEKCVDKIILCAIFTGIGYIFRYRTKRTMKNFLLILMGTYDALLRSKENDKSNCGIATESMK